MDACLEGDAKNYHAWSHRWAVAERFGAWQGELALTARMLDVDVRNNSAWNHRFSALASLAKQCAHRLTTICEAEVAHCDCSRAVTALRAVTLHPVLGQVHGGHFRPLVLDVLGSRGTKHTTFSLGPFAG